MFLLPRGVVAVMVISLLCFAGCRRSTSPSVNAAPQKVRPAAFAGSWYPAEPDELRRFVTGAMANARLPELPGAVVGLLVPHAGYVFSGSVAAYSYRAIQGEKISQVVLLGCPHRVRVIGATLPEADAFATPLGVVKVNASARKKLKALCRFIEISDQPHNPEHSLELQLPFLQVALQDFQILPVLVGNLSEEQSAELARALCRVFAGQRTVMIASSDLSHYPPYEEAKKSDERMLQAIISLDPQKVAQMDRTILREGIPHLECTMCGLEAALVLVRAAKWMGKVKAVELYYRNSGDTEVGEKQRVVGYGAVAFCLPAGTGSIWQSPRADEASGNRGQNKSAQPSVSEEGKRTLLAIARQVVEATASGKPSPDFAISSDELERKAGAFVTLKEHGQLRGCIGVVEPIAPLWEAVAYAARQAASADPRFLPVREEETKDIRIEISVLSPVTRVEKLSDIKVGRDGLIIRKGRQSGLLLPQVPIEQGWNRKQFLEGLCEKAGLPPDAYKEGATLYKFTAQVFGES